MNRRPLWALLARAVVSVVAVVALMIVIPGATKMAEFNAELPTANSEALAKRVPSATAPTASVAPTSNLSVTTPAEEQPGVDLPNLTAGSTPPQFVIVSFDGAAENKAGIFKHWLDVAKKVDGRFSFYLSGVYILPDNRMKLNYAPPKHPRGTSAIGFADPGLVGLRIKRLSEAYRMGSEIGTHYNGHFCGLSGVGQWTTADWTSEISQFNTLLDDWRAFNPQAASAGPLPFNSSVIRGGRTPCLEGRQSQMYPAFKAAGHEYDTSGGGELKWPQLDKYGLWEIPLQAIKVPGIISGRVLSMDYNFLANQNGQRLTASPERCKTIADQSYRAYANALSAVRNGNRAPLILGNHMNSWVCGAYTNGLTRFIEDTHAMDSGVRFISSLDLVRWMKAQEPALLAPWLARPVQE